MSLEGKAQGSGSATASLTAIIDLTRKGSRWLLGIGLVLWALGLTIHYGASDRFSGFSKTIATIISDLFNSVSTNILSFVLIVRVGLWLADRHPGSRRPFV